MYSTYFDGLDSLIEWLFPAAKEYPVALLIYLFLVLIPVVIFVWVLRSFRKGKRGDK